MLTTSVPTSFSQRSVGEIATTLPGATAVFRSFKLDFCCNGDAPLAEAAARRGADLAAIQQALAALVTVAELPPEIESAPLIEHIVTRFHETHRRELPELIRLAKKVERVHGEHPKVPHGLAAHLQQIKTELEDHMAKEEQVLFPLLRQGGHPMIASPITQMRHEHDHHGVQLRRLQEITDDFRLPDGACRSWQALYVGTAKLVDDVMEHIHLENNVLFPRYAAVAGADR